MKKTELIHTHGLLVELRKYFEMNFDDNIDTAKYDELGVAPTGIHLQKSDHEDAVFALASALTDHNELNADSETEQALSASAD